MRVCVVARVVPVHGIGGMQDHTMDLACGLARAGHEVDVITGRHPKGIQVEESGGVRWHYVETRADDFTSREWRVQSYEAFRSLNAEHPFDVIHGEGSSALELVRRGVYRETPLVNLFHGNFFSRVRESLQAQLRRPTPLNVLREQRRLLYIARRHFAKSNWWIFRRCEAIVPSRQQLVATCRAHLLDPARVHVVPNGIDTSLFRPRPRDELRESLGLPAGFLFVCAGRLDPKKGLQHALRALAIGADDMPDARLLVVGEGVARRPLEQLASSLGIEDRIVFTGAQPRERMPELLAAADAFLFPTEQEEAAPLVLPQAMACALPVIAARLGGIIEVIDKPNENGLLVPPGDPVALAAASASVYRDPDLRERLSRGALARVRAAYTLEQMISGTIDVYEVAQRRSAG